MCVCERLCVLLVLLLYGGCCLLLSPLGTHAQELNCTCQVEHGRCDEDTGECRCDPGWGGAECADCMRMPGCVYGSCHQPWQCTCQPGWTGRFCDKDVHVCSKQQPCVNGATCVTDEAGDYSCICPPGYHGNHCQLKMGPCYSTKSPCKNGGQCEDLGGFSPVLACRCLAGFSGPRCETDVDDCQLQPCANGATCVDGVNRFSCRCPPGITGRFCSSNRDDCASRPCLNGGRCLDRVNAFLCLCQRGYSGTTCHVPPWSRQEGALESRGGTGGGNRTQDAGEGGTGGGTGGATGDSRLLKISVKEVLARRGGAGGLSEGQLVLLLVLGGVTLAVVVLTGALVLRGRCQEHCGCPCRCRPPPPASSSSSSPSSSSPPPHTSPLQLFRGCRAVRGTSGSSAPPPEQECKISFLEPATSDPAEPEKKKLNSEVI